MRIGRNPIQVGSFRNMVRGRMTNEMFKLLDLFSGIGGFSLGLERTGGFKTVAFCEIEPFCRRVLNKHWPEVPCYDDVRQLTAARLAADGIIRLADDEQSAHDGRSMADT